MYAPLNKPCLLMDEEVGIKSGLQCIKLFLPQRGLFLRDKFARADR